jgi:hypothetical protein
MSNDNPTDDAAKLIQRTVDITNEEAERVASATVQLAKPDNFKTTTAIPEGLPEKSPAEQNTLTRRAFALGGAVGVALGASIVPLGTNILGKLLSNGISTKTRDRVTGTDLSDRIFGFDFDQGVLDFIESARHAPNLVTSFNARYVDAEQPAKYIVRLIDEFDRGLIADESDFLGMRRLLDLSSTPHSRAFLADLIVSQYVRVGRGIEAKEVLERMPSIEGGGRSARLKYIEKVFSTEYVTLPEDKYLKPEEWGFDRALRLFNDTVGDAIGMQLGERAGRYNIRSIPKLSPDVVQGFANDLRVQGFYSLFWTLHYMVASCDKQQLKDLADMEYKLLKLFADPKCRMQRAVWNTLSIAAFQFQRKGAFEVRDKFVRAALGADRWFWKGDIRTELDKRLNEYGTDMMPVFFLLFINSIPDLRAKLKLDNTFGLQRLERIAAGRGIIRPQAVASAVDVMRKLRREEVSVPEAIRDYLAGDGTLRVYVGSSEQLIKGFKKL